MSASGRAREAEDLTQVSAAQSGKVYTNRGEETQFLPGETPPAPRISTRTDRALHFRCIDGVHSSRFAYVNRYANGNGFAFLCLSTTRAGAGVGTIPFQPGDEPLATTSVRPREGDRVG